MMWVNRNTLRLMLKTEMAKMMLFLCINKKKLRKKKNKMKRWKLEHKKHEIFSWDVRLLFSIFQTNTFRLLGIVPLSMSTTLKCIFHTALFPHFFEINLISRLKWKYYTFICLRLNYLKLIHYVDTFVNIIKIWDWFISNWNDSTCGRISPH